MIKRIVSKVLRTPLFSRIFIRQILKLHSFCYEVSGGMAIQLENGIHPKHRIMQYKEWFVDNLGENDVVLDVGCNTGMMPEVMSSKAKFVYGIEIVAKYIEEAKSKRNRDNVKFICADATTYDYTKCRPITCVTLSNVLEHVEHRIDFLKGLVSQIIWRDEADKKLLIRVPMIDREWITIYKKELGVDYRLDPTHYTEYTYAEFQQELAASGVQILFYRVRFGELYAVCKAD